MTCVACPPWSRPLLPPVRPCPSPHRVAGAPGWPVLGPACWRVSSAYAHMSSQWLLSASHQIASDDDAVEHIVYDVVQLPCYTGPAACPHTCMANHSIVTAR
jgi:hypothetical protein